MAKLQGKTALVTGAAMGIGRASAELFAAEGARVVVADIDPSGEAVAQGIRDRGGEAIFVKVNLAVEEECKAMVDAAIAYGGGRLEILFNNAGTTVPRVLEETTNEEFERIMGVNVRGVFWTCKYAIPTMKAQGGGVILTNASKVGLVAQRNTAAYCTSKGAVIQMMNAMALDLAPAKIRVNTICPGIIDTPLLRRELARDNRFDQEWDRCVASVPMGRIGFSEECAKAALFLVSDDASYITGVDLPVDGGFLAQ